MENPLKVISNPRHLSSIQPGRRMNRKLTNYHDDPAMKIGKEERTANLELNEAHQLETKLLPCSITFKGKATTEMTSANWQGWSVKGELIAMEIYADGLCKAVVMDGENEWVSVLLG